MLLNLSITEKTSKTISGRIGNLISVRCESSSETTTTLAPSHSGLAAETPAKPPHVGLIRKEIENSNGIGKALPPSDERNDL